MTDRLTEIRARLAAATPGPWERWKDGMRVWSRVPPDAPFGVDVADVYASHATADLIAHAPADIAFLLSENEALREQIGFLNEDAGESRLVVKSPQERVWEVWRTTRDRKVATFRTKREATAYVEGGGDA